MGRYEHVMPHHSWNAAHKVSNWLLINLQRHSDHHYKTQPAVPAVAELYPDGRAAIAVWLSADDHGRDDAAALAQGDEPARAALARYVLSGNYQLEDPITRQRCRGQNTLMRFALYFDVKPNALTHPNFDPTIDLSAPIAVITGHWQRLAKGGDLDMLTRSILAVSAALSTASRTVLARLRAITLIACRRSFDHR